MPRKHIRSTSKAQWTPDQLSVAINEVQNGKSIRRAAKDHAIPFSTLQERLKNCVTSGPRLGRKAVFTSDEEAAIVKHLKTLANMYYGLTPLQFRKVAFEYAEKLNIHHRFNTTIKLAGKDWLEGFLKRNPSISIRKPEATSLNRIKGFNKTEVNTFFQNLENVMEKFKFTPNNIYNMDETGITTVQETNKILAPKGQKRIGAVTSGERGQTTTIICAFNAAGTYVPPFFIYARQRMTPLLEGNGPPGSLYKCSKNGWTNEELFIQWLQHFKKYANPSENEPVLLILDNHGSHITIEAYEYCKTNFITMLSLPPHSSHRLQPLDVVFFGPLKKAYNRECDLFMKSHPTERITVYKIAELFNKAYTNVATLAKGISGFSSTGIYPLNSHIFSEEDFPLEQEEAAAISPSRGAQVVAFKDVTPLPDFAQAGPSNVKKMHSQILTATPLKEELEKKKEKREERLKLKERKNSVKKDVLKNVKSIKRKVFDSSDSDVDCPNELDLCQESEDSDSMHLDSDEPEDNLPKEFTLEKQPQQITIGDFLLVTVSNEKAKKDFPSKVVALGKNSISVKFMRAYRGQRHIFVFPEIDDTSVISKDDIVGKLTKICKLRYGKIMFE